jgi:hypothetical protein
MKIKGFILLEVCIAVLIIGLVSGSVYPILKAFETIKTKERLEKIVYSLSAFVQSNNRLPCPGEGEENYPCQATIDGGLLPYKTLQIPKEWIYHSSGKPIVYKVNILLTRKNMQMDYRPIHDMTQPKILSDTQTFCYTPLSYGGLKNKDDIPMAFALDDLFYTRDVFLKFYTKWHCFRE